MLSNRIEILAKLLIQTKIVSSDKLQWMPMGNWNGRQKKLEFWSSFKRYIDYIRAILATFGEIPWIDLAKDISWKKNLVSDISGDKRSPCSWNHLCPCSPCSVSEDKRYPCSWNWNHLCPCQLKLDMKGKINLRWAKRRQLNWYSALYFLISFVGKQLIKPLHFLPKRSDFHSCDLLMPETSKVI